MYNPAAWARHTTGMADWVKRDCPELGRAIGIVSESPQETDAKLVQEALTPESRTADQKLGAQIFSKAAEWFQDELMAKDLRYINDIPSAIKIYHSLASVILTQTPERRDQLINDLLDINGRWRPLKDGHKLYHEIQALAQRVL